MNWAWRDFCSKNVLFVAVSFNIWLCSSSQLLFLQVYFFVCPATDDAILADSSLHTALKLFAKSCVGLRESVDISSKGRGPKIITFEFS